MFVLSWYKTLLRVVYTSTCDLPLSVISIAQQKSNPDLYLEKKINVDNYDFDKDLNDLSLYVYDYISYFNMKFNKQHKDIKGTSSQIVVVG